MEKKPTMQIIVKGKGRIPRIGTLAPRLVPFEVDLETLSAIVKGASITLQVFQANPFDGSLTEVTTQNYIKMFEEYNERKKELVGSVVTTNVDDKVDNKVDNNEEVIVDGAEIEVEEKTDEAGGSEQTSTTEEIINSEETEVIKEEVIDEEINVDVEEDSDDEVPLTPPSDIFVPVSSDNIDEYRPKKKKNK